jgi:zinc transport system ATP-binding protein
MSTEEPVVELAHVTFGYPPHLAADPVLDDVSLRIDASEFLGVIGPNGGGKTTLLKIMLGLLQPQQGTIRVFGRPPAEVRARIGYVPQHARIDPAVPASVLDVVLTGRLARSSWGPSYGPRHVAAAHDALRQTEMEPMADRPLGTLSGGQRQRVLIARALASEAHLLLLDEPTAGVDPHMERGLTDLLHRLNERLPIVVVSHDVSFVSTHLKRVACMNRRLTCHPAREITWDRIARMYHDDVAAVRHDDECPLSDPGCHRGCAPGECESGDCTPGDCGSDERAPGAGSKP